MIRPPPRFTLFPSPTLSRPTVDHRRHADEVEGAPHGGSVAMAAHEDGDVTRSERHRRRSAGVDRHGDALRPRGQQPDRKSTRLNSSHANISYAVFCLKKKNT